MILGTLCSQCGHDTWGTVGKSFGLPYMQCHSPQCLEKKNPDRCSFCHLCSSRIDHINRQKMRYHNAQCSKRQKLSVRKHVPSNAAVSTGLNCRHCALDRWTKIGGSLGMWLMGCVSPNCIANPNCWDSRYFCPLCFYPFDGTVSRQKIRSHTKLCPSSSKKSTDVVFVPDDVDDVESPPQPDDFDFLSQQTEGDGDDAVNSETRSIADRVRGADLSYLGNSGT